MEPLPVFPKPGCAMVIGNVQMAVMKPKPCAVSLSGFVIKIRSHIIATGIAE